MAIRKKKIMSPIGFASICLVLSAGVMLVGGCGEDADKSGSNNANPAVRKSSDGTVKVVVSIADDQARIAEPVNLKIQATAPKGVEVNLPDLAGKLGKFRLLDVSKTPDIPDGSQRLWTWDCKIQSLHSGPQEIPSVKVEYADSRVGDTPRHGRIETEPMKLRVLSVLEGKADPMKFRDIKSTVDIPGEPDYGWVYPVALGGVGLAVGLAGVGYWARRRRNRMLTADKWAMAQLDKLIAAGLLKEGKVREFFYRMTDIIRQYIERRFAIRAKRQSTPEFLQAVAKTAIFSESQSQTLGEFLQSADMVKFARFQPGETEISNAVSVAKNFVKETALRSKEQNSTSADNASAMQKGRLSA